MSKHIVSQYYEIRCLEKEFIIQQEETDPFHTHSHFARIGAWVRSSITFFRK